MKTSCAYCNSELQRKPCRVKNRNYCNTTHQNKYEYLTGIKDRITIADSAHKATSSRMLKNWNEKKPRKYLDKRGYLQVQTPSGRIAEHHLTWSAYNAGLQLPKGFVIHHLNGKKTDNRIENLQMMPEEYHLQLHAFMRARNEAGQWSSIKVE